MFHFSISFRSKLSAVATAYIADGLLWHEDSDTFDSLFNPEIHPRILAYFSVNLFTNVVMTCESHRRR